MAGRGPAVEVQHQALDRAGWRGDAELEARLHGLLPICALLQNVQFKFFDTT